MSVITACLDQNPELEEIIVEIEDETEIPKKYREKLLRALEDANYYSETAREKVKEVYLTFLDDYKKMLLAAAQLSDERSDEESSNVRLSWDHEETIYENIHPDSPSTRRICVRKISKAGRASRKFHRLEGGIKGPNPDNFLGFSCTETGIFRGNSDAYTDLGAWEYYDPEKEVMTVRVGLIKKDENKFYGWEMIYNEESNVEDRRVFVGWKYLDEPMQECGIYINPDGTKEIATTEINQQLVMFHLGLSIAKNMWKTADVSA